MSALTLYHDLNKENRVTKPTNETGRRLQVVPRATEDGAYIGSHRRMIAFHFITFLFLALLDAPADADVVDSPSPHVYRGREMTERELRDFASADAKFLMSDLRTGETGHLTVLKGIIQMSWYFAGDAPVAILDRFGHASICIRRGDEPTKCIAILSDPHSDSCPYLIREIHDDRRACLRRIQAP